MYIMDSLTRVGFCTPCPLIIKAVAPVTTMLLCLARANDLILIYHSFKVKSMKQTLPRNYKTSKDSGLSMADAIGAWQTKIGVELYWVRVGVDPVIRP